MPLLRQSLAVPRRLAAFAAVALAGCGDDPTDLDPVTITLTPASITAIPGDTVRVRVSTTGGGTIGSLVLGSSSAAARVDADGVVTAVSPGTSVISATFDFNGQRVTGTIPVTVLGLSLEPARAAIAVGGSAFLRPNFVGDFARYGGFRWSSSDSSVAVPIDLSGTVRGLRPGVARIIATAVNEPRLRAEATVTVVGVEPLVLSLVVQPTTITLATGATQQLAATLQLAPGAPPGTSREVRFVSSDTTVATVAPTGLVTARRSGTAVVTVFPVAAPTITQAVRVTVRDAGGGRLTIQSITSGDPPVPVNPNAVRGRIRVTSNYLIAPELEPRRVELWLAGRRAAATDSVPRPSDGSLGTVTLEIDTDLRDAQSGARLYPNGATDLEVRVVYAVTGTSETQTATIVQRLTLANP